MDKIRGPVNADKCRMELYVRCMCFVCMRYGAAIGLAYI